MLVIRLASMFTRCSGQQDSDTPRDAAGVQAAAALMNGAIRLRLLSAVRSDISLHAEAAAVILAAYDSLLVADSLQDEDMPRLAAMLSRSRPCAEAAARLLLGAQLYWWQNPRSAPLSPSTCGHITRTDSTRHGGLEACEQEGDADSNDSMLQELGTPHEVEAPTGDICASRGWHAQRVGG